MGECALLCATTDDAAAPLIVVGGYTLNGFQVIKGAVGAASAKTKPITAQNFYKDGVKVPNASTTPTSNPAGQTQPKAAAATAGKTPKQTTIKNHKGKMVGIIFTGGYSINDITQNEST